MDHEFCLEFLRDRILKLPGGVELKHFVVHEVTLGWEVTGPRSFQWYGKACCKSDALVRAIDEYLSHFGYAKRNIPKVVMDTINSRLAEKRVEQLKAQTTKRKRGG